MKKILYSLGTLAAVATPISAVVACGRHDTVHAVTEVTLTKEQRDALSIQTTGLYTELAKVAALFTGPAPATMAVDNIVKGSDTTTITYSSTTAIKRTAGAATTKHTLTVTVKNSDGTIVSVAKNGTAVSDDKLKLVKAAADAVAKTLVEAVKKEVEKPADTTTGGGATSHSWDKTLPTAPIYAKGDGTYTTTKTQADGYVAPHAGKQKAIPAGTPSVGATLTIVTADGTSHTVEAKSGTKTWSPDLPQGAIYEASAATISAHSGWTHTVDKTKAKDYVAHADAVQGKYTFTVGSQTYKVEGKADGTTSMADATGVTVAVSGGNGETVEVKSTVELTIPGTYTKASAGASTINTNGPITTGIIVAQTTAPQQEVSTTTPVDAKPGVWIVTGTSTASTTSVTLTITGPADGTNPGTLSSSITLADLTTALGADGKGYTVTTTGGAVSDIATTLKDLGSDYAIAEDTTPAIASSSSSVTTPAAAGVWTIAAAGMTFTVTGPADGTNPGHLADGITTLPSGFSLASSGGVAPVAAKQMDVTVTLPTGITTSSDNVGTLTFKADYATSAPVVTGFSATATAAPEVSEKLPIAVSLDAAAVGATAINIDGTAHTIATAVAYDWSTITGGKPAQLFELKTDDKKYTTDETKAAEYKAEVIPAAKSAADLVTAATAATDHSVTIDGTKYTYTA